MAELHSEIGKRLRSERKRIGIKSPDVAKTLHIHTNSLFNYEKGLRDIPAFLLPPLRDLGYDVHYVLFGEEMPLCAKCGAKKTN